MIFKKKDEVTLSLDNAMNQLDEVREIFGAEHKDEVKEETKERSKLGDPKMNSLARSNASLYGNKEELYDRLRRHAYHGNGKKGKKKVQRL